MLPNRQLPKIKQLKNRTQIPTFLAILPGVILFVISVATSFAAMCNAEQTASYLKEGTTYTLTQKTVDYVIVIDRSGSMEGPKLEKVKQAAKSLISQLPSNERAAIISFNYDATVHQGLTNNHEQLYDSIDTMKGEYGTQYAPPLLAAQKQFLAAGKNKALIFLSDGKSDFGETPDAILALSDSLSDIGACILTVSYALGGEESELLKQMAENGKTRGCGEHFIASEKGNELEEVFSAIHDTLSATDVINVTAVLMGNASYEFTYTSKFNSLPIPGKGANKDSCVDSPKLTLSLFKDRKLVATYGPNATGLISLPAGEYSYEAVANIKCEGTCSYTGSKKGTLAITGVCNPSYPDLAEYVTGETQRVQITPNGFSPSAISGKQGTVVLWYNNDTEKRRVQSVYFDEEIEPGESFKYVIGNIGTLLYSDPDKNQSGNVIPIKGTGTDVLLIMDESGSMKGEGILEARNAASQFFDLLSPVDRGALMTFSQDANLLQDFTSDTALLQNAAQKIVSKGPTNYLSALLLAQKVHRTQKSVLVFMSDGTPTDQEGTKAILAEVNKLRKKDWCIMTVGFGKESEEAENILLAMAGDDQCSAFLYASTGSLARTFGTIYQLAHAQNDLLFSDLHVPRISFTKNLQINTIIRTKIGNTVPGGELVCSPAALVQVRSSAESVELKYSEKKYQGTIRIAKIVERISIIAAVGSEEEPSRTFVGRTYVTIIYIPPWLSALVLVIILGIIVIYWRLRAPRNEERNTS